MKNASGSIITIQPARVRCMSHNTGEANNPSASDAGEAIKKDFIIEEVKDK